MQYKVESIGAEFSTGAIRALEKRLDANADAGYKFHSVFQVSSTGCLGMGGGTTYLAVYTKE